jgi:hypothetical protein
MQLAKQGDGRAIATLLNRAFEKQGIAVKVNLKGRCLQVLLEATPAPEPFAAMTLMQQAMSRLQPELLERVEVYGREVGAKSFSWQQELRLQPLQSPASGSSLATSQTPAQGSPELRQLAQKGDPEAIAKLLNAALAELGITTQVSWQNYCLQIVLQGETIPDRASTLVAIDGELIALESFLIQKLVVQGQVKGSETQNWKEEFELGTHAKTTAPLSPNATGSQVAAPATPQALELNQTSPHLQHPFPIGEGMAKREARYASHRKNPASSPTKPRPQAVTNAGWGAVLTGFVLAVILFLLSPLKLLFRGFLVLVHEVGHALTHWLFGRPAIPMIDFAFGGGITLSFEQSWLILGLIYLAIAYGIWLCRVYPRLQGVLVLLTGLYSFCLFSNWNLILSTFMGHGMEIVAIFTCLYLSVSGYFCRMSGDRAIYAMLGFFTWFCDLQFGWQLLYDLDFQSWYDEGKGGVIDNDLVILASDYFNVDLSTIASIFLGVFIAAPILAVLAFRYESWLQAGLRKLLVT